MFDFALFRNGLLKYWILTDKMETIKEYAEVCNDHLHTVVSGCKQERRKKNKGVLYYISFYSVLQKKRIRGELIRKLEFLYENSKT